MSKKWILVVDDDPVVRGLLAAALEHPDLTVTTAEDALQAFIQARDLKPLLIVSDIMMPGYGDGPSALKKLREDPRVPVCPIVFVTSMDLAEARKLLPSGDPTVGILPKPVDLRRLREYAWNLAGVRGRAACGE